VAQSYFHDITPAQELGIKRIWVNRQHEKSDPAIADAMIHGLAALPGALAKVG
jgi:2-haloacid dehalogenase